MCESKGYIYRIGFLDDIMEDVVHNRGEQCLSYTFECWKNSALFDIINDISQYFTLVQLLDTVSNVIHTVIFLGIGYLI